MRIAMRGLSVLLLVIVTLTFGRPAAAQPAIGRGYLSAGADIVVVPSNFTDAVHPIDFGEAAVVNTTYKPRVAPGLEVAGGVRVWRHLAVGLAVSRVTKTSGGAVDAQVPHPFFFGRPRSVSGDASGLHRDETAIHLQARLLPSTARWQATLIGGPSWINVRQDLVDDVTVTQSYPFDTATFSGVAKQRVSKSHLGFNAGVDATYWMKPRVGIGVAALFARARVPLTSSATTDAGGMHVTAGLRLGF
jgi:hypothetical protein